MLIEDLGNQGEAMLTQNIKPSEQILAKVKGISGEGIVLTDKSVYLLKWGGLVGSTLGVGKGVGSFKYEEILDVALTKALLSSTLEFTLKGETRLSFTKIVIGSVKNTFESFLGKDTPFQDYVRARFATFGRVKASILNELLEFIKGKITA